MTLSEYINTIRDKKIAVIGIGISNEPLIRLLAFEGCNVTACDKRDFEKLGAKALELISMGVKLKLGETYLDDLDYDIIFRTPGLMPFDEHLASAKEKGSIITSEMELFFALCPCPIFAVTGSDGKTTTTTIISELLKKAGYNIHLGGNIGKPLLCELPFFKKDDIAVLELSSFQLHSMPCRPNVAVITNISPNHLDKHKDYQDYIDAKKSIYLNQHEDDLLVLNLDDEHTPEFLSSAKSRVKFFSFDSAPENGTFYDEGNIYRIHNGEKAFLMNAGDILIPGDHNIKNYLAAFAATEGYVSDDICISTAKSFAGVEHRLETVRVLNGVRYINDSIGSSPSRTIAGLHALKTKPIIIVGGYDKKIPFDTLGDELCKGAKKVIFTGATADKIKEAVLNSALYPESGLLLESVPDFKEAVLAASASAHDGDIVLLSPACASFDHFANFEERGNYFKNIVMEL